MKKYRFQIFVILLLCLLICSCAQLSPFLSNGKTRALNFGCYEKDTMIYVNVKKSTPFIKKLIGNNKLDSVIKRLNDIVLIANPTETYGIIEGKFPLMARDIIVKNVKAKKITEQNMTYYQINSEDGKIIKFNLIYPGVIFFTMNDYPTCYEKFFSTEQPKKETLGVSDIMQQHSISMYGINPSNNLSEMFKEGYLSGCLFMMDFDKKDNVILNGVLQFTSEEILNVMQTTMQQDTVKFMKESGQKLNLIDMMFRCKFSKEDRTMIYNNLSIPMEMMSGMMNNDGKN